MRLPLDIASHEPHGIVTIAHRGGIVRNGAHIPGCQNQEAVTGTDVGGVLARVKHPKDWE